MPRRAPLSGLAIVLGALLAGGARAREDFEGPRIIRHGSVIVRLVEGDFDHDGVRDVLVLSGSPQLYSADGAGGLIPREDPFASGVATRQALAADLDADGETDVVLGIGQTSLVAYLGDGALGFTEAGSCSTGFSLRSLAAADFDEDGNLDVFAKSTITGRVRFHFGDGAGGFPRARTDQLLIGANGQVAAGDLDEDGHVDLLFAIPELDDLLAYFGDGTGAYARFRAFKLASGPNFVVLEDLDGDGRLDLLASCDASRDCVFLRGDGAFGFTEVSRVLTGSDVTGILISDFDGNGLPDLAIASGRESAIGVFRGVAPFHFERVQVLRGFTSLRAPVAIDLDLDGTLDLVASNSGTLLAFRGRGDGRFENVRQFDVPASGGSMSAIDFDGDGRLDLVAGNRSGRSVAILRGDGAGGLSVAASVATGLVPSNVLPGDIVEDGHPDAIVVGEDAYGLLRATPGGGFEFARVFGIAAAPDGALGDVNEDGHLDLAIALDNDLRLLLAHPGDGTGNFGRPIESPAAPNRLATTLADLDGDGHLDAVLPASFRTDVHRGDGSGRFTAAGSIALSANHALAADFDGDGSADVVTTTHFEPGASGSERSRTNVSFGDGAFGFAPTVLVDSENTQGRTAAADVDGDGRLELLTSSTGNRLTVWTAREDRTFDLSGTFWDARRALAPGDFDDDGQVDVAAGRPEGGISIILNRTADLPENACRRGNVNGAVGPVTDVLFVNGRKGLGAARRLYVDRNEPFQIRMKAPPALGLGPAAFALFAWIGPPDASSPSEAPGGYGMICKPFDRVKKRWNNTADPLFGAPDFASSPAPSLVLRRERGLRKSITVFLQGIVEDPSSQSGEWAVTNGVEIVSR